jgi:anti-anti-sigma factor
MSMATLSTPEALYGYLDDCVVLVLRGQLRYTAAKPLRAFIDELIAKAVDEAVVIDLREIDFLDSTGMGLLARIGRATLARGRRSIIVCPRCDVMTCLRSAAFDTLFIVVDSWPFEQSMELYEIPLEEKPLLAYVMGNLMLDAHRDLAAVSDENRRVFGGVIEALEAELGHGVRTRFD